MTAAAHHLDSPPEFQSITAEDIFRERAEARAILYAAAEFDLQTAVDQLQAHAVRSGLLAEIGPDQVQAIMARAFHRWARP
jgi:hypothetical protein